MFVCLFFLNKPKLSSALCWTVPYRYLLNYDKNWFETSKSIKFVNFMSNELFSQILIIITV